MNLINLLLAICLIGCGHNPPAGGDLPDVAGLAAQNNRFAIDLYQQLSPDNDNILFSPYSLSNALSMTLAGAGGDTEKQMEMALGVDMGKKDLFAAFSDLNRTINELNRQAGISVLCANGLWAQTGHPFRKAFLKLVADDFNAEIRQVDFVTGHEYQRRQINAWVEQKTNHKITELLPADALDPRTRMVLVNAVYFKGDWAVPFNPEMTKKAAFRAYPEGPYAVPMMCRQAEFNYTRDERFEMLELPYAGQSASMLILLPDSRDDFKEVGKVLTADYVNDLYGRLAKHDVRVLLPRFKVQGNFSLSGVLRTMGMGDAFDGRADFSGMNGEKSLYLNEVIHKAVIEVDEKGSEAAAATGVVMRATSAIPKITVFQADHPFVFLIRENKTGLILFLGRLVKPV